MIESNLARRLGFRTNLVRQTNRSLLGGQLPIEKASPLSFRQVQAVWGFAMAFAAVCIVFGVITRKHFERSLTWRHALLSGVVLWSVVSGLSVREKLLKRAKAIEGADNDPSDSSKPWTAAQLLGIMLAASVVAWGLVCDWIVGSPHWLCNAFYVVGVLVFFRFKPSKTPVLR